jgi:DNA-binding NtrC family response regulator
MSVEGKLIRQALQACGGNLARTAKILGLKESTLRYRMKRYGISSQKEGKAKHPRHAENS